MLEEKVLIDNMEKYNKKMDIMKRKYKLWGLEDTEKNELVSLSTNYLQNFYQLVEITFNNYIEPLLYTEEIIELKNNMKEKYNWDGQVYYFDEDMDTIKYKDFNEMENDCYNLMKLELEAYEKTKDEESIKYFENLFAELQNEDAGESIYNYIQKRYDFCILIIGWR